MATSGMVRPKTYGRFGNFLFQAATAMGYAWRHGMDYTLPNVTNDAKHNPLYLQHLVNPKWDPQLPTITLKEHGHQFQKIPFEQAWKEKNIVLDGYWQSEKYFLEFRQEVLRAFGYQWFLREGWVSVHVRRTDYLTLAKKHPPVPTEWMVAQMAKFPGFKFRFFSDDIGWCKQTFHMRADCSFSEEKNEEADLVHMSQCEHHICSASTFSWWGAWLNQNPNKRIIMPKHWFQPGYRGLNTADIVPASWERV